MGRHFVREICHGEAPGIQRWPACTALVTVGAAVETYAAGTFWDHLWEFTGVQSHLKQKQSPARAWGEGFLLSLRRIGLPDAVPGTRKRNKYVAAALLHAGIPTHCLDDFFDLLLDYRERTLFTDAEAFRVWVNDSSGRRARLDTPVRHFLASDAHHVLETIRRSDRVLSLFERGETSVPMGEGDLPQRFDQPARNALARRFALGCAAPRRPDHGLLLDREREQVVVHLPAHTHWQVRTADGTRIEAQGVSEEDEAGDDHPVHPLSSPTAALRIGPAGGEAHQVDLMPADDQLLLFTDSEPHRWIRPHRELPTGRLWALHPNDRLLGSTGVRALYSESMPGWGGWTCSLLELDDNSWIRVAAGPIHRFRGTGGFGLALKASSALPGVEDEDGTPVHSALPELVLPERPATTWTVEVLVRQSGGLTLRYSFEAPSGTRVSPLERLPEPRLGTFTVKASCPEGLKRSWPVALAEGVEVHVHPPLRLFEYEGLQPGRAQLHVPGALTAKPARMTFSAHRTTRRCRVESLFGALPIRVSVPHLQVRIDDGPWHDRPLQLTPEELRGAAGLAVRISDETSRLPRPQLMIAAADSTELQQITPLGRSAGNTHAFAVARLSETAAQHSHTELMLVLPQGVTRVAEVNPPPLAQEARFEDEYIQFTGVTPGIQMEAALYAWYAPWRPPVLLGVDGNGRVCTEEHPEIGGPVRVLLQEVDPWSARARQWPSWPTSGDGTILEYEMPGRPNSADLDEDLLCRFLAGGGAACSVDDVITPHNRARTRQLPRAFTEEASEVLRGRVALLGRFRRGPSASSPARTHTTVKALSFEDFLESMPPVRVGVPELVLNGTVSSPPRFRPGAAQAAQAWQAHPVIAALHSRDWIRGTPFGSAHVDGADAADPLAEIVRRCGADAVSLLVGQPRPGAERVLRLASPSSFNQSWRTHLNEAFAPTRTPIPELLDPGVLMAAMIRCFQLSPKARRHFVQGGHGVDLTLFQACAELVPALGDSLRRELDHRRTLAQRYPGHLPLLSLALAVNGRLAARPHPPEECVRLARSHHRFWAELAKCLPELVALDIVLAELTAAGAERALLQAGSRV
ncbi:hypothetical protein [Nocardiopsis metallicus]|uniref:Uncharacterized protein n=1 Tax=Nocardiopsis metallicus TaxID=179819 RepID=A0A840WL54_9ACTN|nr:hypothetical protein [Nocardiopsis metallicus]MBB5490838.1 hypothetical protein [Nocardiopsis metallicus]